MNSKRLFVSIVVVILLAFGGWKLFQMTSKEIVGDVLTLYGNVDIRDVVLSFRVSGRIAEMRFEEGDRIAKGTIVATLDKDTFAEDLAMAKAELAEAEAAFRNAERAYKRSAKLVKTGAVPLSLYDEALAARDESRAKVQTAKTRVAKTETALEDTKIKAPADGTILTRVREPGSIVSAGQPVYTLAVDNPVWIRTYVAEPDLGRIYPGQPAKVYTDSRPDQPYAGQIGFISPQAEFTPKNVETTQLRTDLVYRLRVIVDNPDRGLRQGMPVTVKIDTTPE